MERKELKKLGGEERFEFKGNFERFGVKRGWEGVEEDTILLKDITLLKDNKKVASHLWFNLTSGFENALFGTERFEIGNNKKFFFELNKEEKEQITNKMKGKSLCFHGRVEDYEKGWQGRKAEEYSEARKEKDWKISRPTKVRLC